MGIDTHHFTQEFQEVQTSHSLPATICPRTVALNSVPLNQHQPGARVQLCLLGCTIDKIKISKGKV